MGTKDDLLAAAEALVAEHGYAGVGIREIATRAHANLSAIKYHFGGKPDLYLATIRRSLLQPDVEAVWALLEPSPASRAEAGRMLVAFVRAWFARLCRVGEPNVCARLMLREALQPTAALDVVVRDFMEPNETSLVGVVRALAPDGLPAEHLAAARSVIGQLVHYLVFRPFLERRSPGGGFDPGHLEKIADHVAAFSLRGLGCTEAFVRKALANKNSLSIRSELESSS
jgi:AcrR family transcriptional regulator